MPRLVCWNCGRLVYSTAPLEALFAEERRCPRCEVQMNGDRRAIDRRQGGDRRVNPPGDPGPPDGVERRVADRRLKQRRRRP